MSIAPAGIPPASVALTEDGKSIAGPWRRFLESLWRRTGGFAEISVAAADNTHLVFSYKGTDGVVRTGSLTLT